MNPNYCEIVPDFWFAWKPEREHSIALTVALSLADDVLERRCGLLRCMSPLMAPQRTSGRRFNRFRAGFSIRAA